MLRTRTWSDEDKARAEDLVTGYVDGLMRALVAFDVEQEELDNVLLDINVEACPCCGWYVPSWDLLPPLSDDPDGHCGNCRPSGSL